MAYEVIEKLAGLRIDRDEDGLITGVEASKVLEIIQDNVNIGVAKRSFSNITLQEAIALLQGLL